jgi:hypothetical protein
MIDKEESIVFFCLRCANFFARFSSFPSLLRRTRDVHIVGCLSRLKSESIIFDSLDCSEVSKDEDGPSEKVEDAIENHLVVYADNVATLCKAPANGVKQPNKCNVSCGVAVHHLLRKEARPEPTE